MSPFTKTPLALVGSALLLMLACRVGSVAVGPPPSPDPTAVPPPTSVLEGRYLVVSSPEDSGPGTLRQALSRAEAGDTIRFDPAVFPPEEPQTITVESELPHIRVSHLTLDASDVGVILDGGELPEDWIAGLQLVSSSANVIQGMQITNFPGPAIAISGSAEDNVIGGDRSLGEGPSGQGNTLTRSAIGVDLATPATTGNVIQGNLIGVDAGGEMGNQRSGVAISEGAHGNTIGPDNEVAFNGQCGVEVSGDESRRNLITRNAIHDNGAAGICLTFGANQDIPAPVIGGIEWAAGVATGTACPGCLLEVYSDRSDQGASYEGQSTADEEGRFSFEKVGPFVHGHVTVTATDADGNTSELARAVNQEGGSRTLQEGNIQPPTALLAKRSGQLVDNRMSANLVGPQLWLEIVPSHQYLSAYLLDLGVKRVNTSLNEVEPPITWEASEFVIPPEYDRVIDAMLENGVEVNYMLHFWDKEGHAGGESLSVPRFRDPEQIEDFLRYVRFIVSHFRGRVQYYTLWTEPDNCHQAGGIKCIRVGDYIELARQVVPVIREEDPAAKVSVAPVVLFFERDFLPAVLRSDVGPMFDVVQWHGLYDVRPDNQYYGTYYYDYPSIVDRIRGVGAASGFQGEYWSTDMNWASEQFHHQTTDDQPWVDIQGTDKQAAKYYSRSIVMHLAMGIAPGLENGQPEPTWPWSHPTVQLLSTVMAGARPTNLAAEIRGAPADSRLMSYAFRVQQWRHAVRAVDGWGRAGE